MEAETQTEARPGPVLYTGQIESRPEYQNHSPKKSRRVPVSRIISSSSPEAESAGTSGAVVRPSRQAGSQGL